MGKRIITLSLVGFLGACSLVHPPPVQLPSRSGITPGETITVLGNQNVYGVAKQYNVSMRELIVLNDIRAPFVLRPGQKLVLPADKLPAGGEQSYGSYATASSSASPSYSSASAAPAPVSASPGAVESAELPPVEPAPVTQETLTPPPVTGGPVSAAPAHSLAPAPAAASNSSATQVTALNAPTPPPKPVATTVAGGVPATASATAPAESKSESAPEFNWPVQGPVLSGFGPKGQGLSNDGVNIGAPKGAPVVAAASGIVVYAGNEMKGFGNLVLIRHSGGWVTAYAHLDRTLVTKDVVVAQGDMIGTVGKTGDVPSPQLHFETRLNGKPVDPTTVIKAQ